MQALAKFYHFQIFVLSHVEYKGYAVMNQSVLHLTHVLLRFYR